MNGYDQHGRPSRPLHDLLGIPPTIEYQAHASFKSINDYSSVSPNLREDFQSVQSTLMSLANDVSNLKSRISLQDELFSVIMGEENNEQAFMTYLTGCGLDNLKVMAIMDRIYKIRGTLGGSHV